MAWADILGQPFAVQLLQMHVASGQVAHAYLLAGPDGVGKRRIALELAKTLNCSDEQRRPCDVCRSCVHIANGTHPDIHHLICGGASDQIKIEEVRRLIGRLALRPYSARMQVAIIDGADRLTDQAANSMLKVLEEPPAHARWILLTSQLSRCLPTIRSRCQLIRCQRLSVEILERLLLEHQSRDSAQARMMVQLSEGSASRALDVTASWSEYQRILERLADDRVSSWLEQPLPETREGVTALLDGMVRWLRDVAVTAASEQVPIAHVTYAQALQRQAKHFDVEQCFETLQALLALRESLEQFVSPRLVATVARERWLNLAAPS